jgi:hypothetical protein
VFPGVPLRRKGREQTTGPTTVVGWRLVIIRRQGKRALKKSASYPQSAPAQRTH